MSSKMKVAIITHHPSQYESPFYKILSKDENVDLTVNYISDIIIDPELGMKPKWDKDIKEGYKNSFLDSITLIHFLQDVLNKKYHAILIHGYYNQSLLTFIAAKIARVPIMFRGDSILLYTTSNYRELIKKIILPFFYRRFNAFLVVGTLNKQFYNRYGVESKKLFLVPYAVNNNFFQKKVENLKDKRIQLREELGIAENSIVILSVVKFIERERPIDLLKVQKELSQFYDNVDLVIVGDGEQRSYLEEIIKNENIEKVHLVGYIKYTKLPEFYMLSDIFVHPAIDECWGLSVNEAAASGLPIVASNYVGSAVDIVDDGFNGFKYSAMNINELFASLKILIEDHEKIKIMGNNSKMKVAQFGYEQCLKGFLDALNFIKSRE